MSNLKKIDKIHAKSLAKYKINEHTTEYGTIIFDNSRGGKISNSFLYHIGFEKNGHIDIYIDRTKGIINSIWFVNLNCEVSFCDKSIKFEKKKDYHLPIFDISIWGKEYLSLWPKINDDTPVEVYHNCKNIIHVSFGKKEKLLPINEKIQFQYDKSNNLTGILIRDFHEIPKLINKIRNANTRDKKP